MSGIIAKKYAKALISVCDDAEISKIYGLLNSASALFTDEKFIDIIKSPLINSSEKVDIIVSSALEGNEKFANTIKLLAEKGRLLLIDNVRDEIENYIAVKSNEYDGIVTSKDDLNDSKVSTLESELSKKFGISLKLKKEISEYDGVKVEVPGLGIKVDFAQARLKSQMLNHVLKAL